MPITRRKSFFRFVSARTANIRKAQGYKEEFLQKMDKICSRAGKGAGGGALSSLSPLSPHQKLYINNIYVRAKMPRVFMKIVAMQS